MNIKYAHGRFTLRGAYARGFRAPSLKELYLMFQDVNHDITGNPTLKAELSHHLSFATVYAQPLKLGKLQLEVNAFNNSMRNLITLAQTTGNSFSYVNVGHFETHGLQVKAELSRGKLLASVGGGLIGRLGTLPDSVAGVPAFTYSPELRASILYEIKAIGLKLALFYKFNGRLQSYVLREDGTVGTQRTAAYQIADCSLSRSFWKGAFSVGLGAKNLLGVTQVAANIDTGAHGNGGNQMQVGTGRSYFLQLGLQIQSKQ
jgi:outer membrane receptor for ferrienterochelin and colicins